MKLALRLVTLALGLALACAEAPPPAPAPPPPPPPEPPKPRLVVVPDPPLAHQQLYDLVERLLSDEYALGALKKRSLGWDPKQELARLREGFEKDPPLGKRERQRLLYEVFRSPRDVHAGLAFDRARAVWLGIHLVRTVDGKYRVAWRDAARTPGVSLALGDVVETFDGVPVAEAVSAVIQDTRYKSTGSFEQAFAEWFLVMRGEDVWSRIPSAGNEVRLGLAKTKNKPAREVRLTWLDLDARPPSERCPFWGKTKLGYLPELGSVMWRAPDDSPYPAFVYAAHGATFGYVRFHSYALDSADRARALDTWKQLVTELKKHQARGLVIDQLGNGGGNFHFAYALFSRLTDEPLKVPVQHYLATGRGKLAGFGDRAFLAQQKSELAKITSDADAESLLPQYPLFASMDFMPKTLATAQSFVGFFDSLAELARAGTPGITEPRPAVMAEIAPNPDGVRFSGPVVVLIDGLNLSAAEYAAAALGDSGRARLVGTTTAGAGGDQREYRIDRVCGQAPQNPFQPCLPADTVGELAALDLRSLSHTVTVGRRVDSAGNPSGYIENQGVPPHREHRLTARDLSEKLRDFRAVIFEELGLDRKR